jgi:hypothetical protein
VLIEGELIWLSNCDARRVVSFLRKNDQEQFVTVINLSSMPFQGSVKVDNRELFKDITPTAPDRQTLSHLTLKAWEYRFFKVSSGI